MRFGQTLFAGSSATGLVVAAGIALCSANAVGNQEVLRFVGGNANAVATVTASPLRTASGVPAAALSYATVSGSATGTYSKSGLAQAIASVTTLGAHTDANGAGSASAYATVTGLPYRQIRSYPYRADATAEGHGEGVTYQLGVAAPARAYATALGTTYYIGNGQGDATATASGVPMQETGGAGTATGIATGQALPFYTLGALADGQAKATLNGDAAVTRAGVRYFEGKGLAVARATVVVTNIALYQAQTGRAYATLQGRAVYTIGGAGSALATASAMADGLLGNTSVTGIPANTTATATGRAQVAYSGRGTAPGVALGTIGIVPVIINTKAYGAVAQATAYMQVTPKRTTAAKGSAIASASMVSGPVKGQFTSSKANAYALMVNGSVELSVLGTEAKAYALATADPSKVKYASGSAQAQATAEGFNQINDLLKAPFERTLVVEFISRLLEVDAKDYLLTV